MPDSKAKTDWIKENTIRFTMKLNKNTDADILSALEGKAKQTELKRLVRIALAFENCIPKSN